MYVDVDSDEIRFQCLFSPVHSFVTICGNQDSQDLDTTLPNTRAQAFTKE